MKKGLLFLLSLLIFISSISFSLYGKDDSLNNKDLIQFRFVNEYEDISSDKFILKNTNDILYLDDNVLLNTFDIYHAKLKKGPYGLYGIYIKLKRNKIEKFKKITGENVGRHLGVVINGELIIAPKIKEQIPSGKIVINAKLSEKELTNIVYLINKYKNSK